MKASNFTGTQQASVRNQGEKGGACLQKVGNAGPQWDPKTPCEGKEREVRKEAMKPDDVWAMDFVHDQRAAGRKSRILTDFDTSSRSVPDLDARFSINGEDVVATMDKFFRKAGFP